MPGVQAMLGRCRTARLPCAVASSTKREQLEDRLHRAGLHGYFAGFAGGDEVDHGKPAPDIFLLAAQRLGVEARRCLVFEDSEHGARGAIAAGMGVVIVPDLTVPSAEARAFSTAVLTSLEEADHFFSDWFVAS